MACLNRFLAALALACALISPAAAARRPRAFCTPVYIEGAGTVLICAPTRRR